MSPRLAVVALCTLASCTLIDQRTFNPNADRAPVIPKPVVATPAPPQVGPPALLTIAPGATPDVYRKALGDAVAAARARKPDVVFDVVEMQSPDTPGDVPLGEQAVAVARMIGAQGVAPARVRLVVRPDGAAPVGQVRIFVR